MNRSGTATQAIQAEPRRSIPAPDSRFLPGKGAAGKKTLEIDGASGDMYENKEEHNNMPTTNRRSVNSDAFCRDILS